MSQLSFTFPDMKYTFADFFSGAGAHYDGEAYGYNKIANHVICRNCLKFVKEERKVCPHCNGRMDHPITGGVFHIPGFGLLLDCEGEIPEHVTK